MTGKKVPVCSVQMLFFFLNILNLHLVESMDVEAWTQMAVILQTSTAISDLLCYKKKKNLKEK
jgi:hypothetical protein